MTKEQIETETTFKCKKCGSIKVTVQLPATYRDLAESIRKGFLYGNHGVLKISLQCPVCNQPGHVEIDVW